MKVRRTGVVAWFFSGVFVLCASCAAQKPVATTGAGVAPPTADLWANPGFQSTLWVQTAAEYRAAAESAYNVARAALEAGRSRPGGSAALEQTGDATALPPAVILDVDETVLDNSPYQAWMIRERKLSYTPESWAAWVGRAEAQPVPGALEFTRYAARSGVAVFYVTNRDRSEEAATRVNLEKMGFPVTSEVDAVLTRGERPEWGSDKTSRRALVAASHRLVLLVGDDFGDFVSIEGLSPQQRAELVQTHRGRWGRDWIILPNPMYGSWERALHGHRRDLPEREVMKLKAGWLRGFN